MPHIVVDGQSFELGSKDFYEAIANLAEGYFVLVSSYHHNHAGGFADVNGIMQLTTDSQRQLEVTLLESINDLALRDLIGILRAKLNSMIELDREMVLFIARTVGISGISEKKDRQKLKRKLRKVVAEGEGGRPSGPVWAKTQEFKDYVKRSKEILSEATVAYESTRQRVAELTSD